MVSTPVNHEQTWPCFFSSRSGWNDAPFVDSMLQKQGQKMPEESLPSLLPLALLPSVGPLWVLFLCYNRKPFNERGRGEEKDPCAEAWSPRGADPSCSRKVTLAQEKGLMRIKRIHLLLPTEYLYINMHTFKYISSEEVICLSLLGI